MKLQIICLCVIFICLGCMEVKAETLTNTDEGATVDFDDFFFQPTTITLSGDKLSYEIHADDIKTLTSEEFIIISAVMQWMYSCIDINYDILLDKFIPKRFKVEAE